MNTKSLVDYFCINTIMHSSYSEMMGSMINIRRILQFVSPDFQCVVETPLNPEGLELRLCQNMTDTLYFFGNRSIPFTGVVSAAKFTVEERSWDNLGVFLDGAIEKMDDGSRIYVSSKMSVMDIAGTMVIGLGSVYVMWANFRGPDIVFWGWSLGIMPTLICVVHAIGIRHFRHCVDRALNKLVYTVDGQVVKRFHD